MLLQDSTGLGEIMTDYEKIKAIRSDMTEWILHLTKSFDLLQKILRDGYLKPGLAPRVSGTGSDRKMRPTVRGPHPAVCFTEMPLWAAKELTSISATTQRYFPYGIAFQKLRLFKVGARPVVYAGTDVLGPEVQVSNPSYVAGHRVHEGGLPKLLQYLWVRTDLEATPPRDWTHEREWRCRIDPAFIAGDGLPGVPLMLGRWDRNLIHTFKVVVQTDAEAATIRALVAGLPPQGPTDVPVDYYDHYVRRFTNYGVDIAVLDRVVGVGHKTARIETYF